eukprot:CAMPEP_0181409596 /NCGR_PEP_ID=MMETSP1110-20121109/6900_1 /TAXON_ID=174948 /ORGANISM="Symbiodinium sp., Strain CCMP421" /LENGTH=364 /DNA_ID=CAMNT_0023532107 /DNA_START=51 /DNA_END=1146 /DNA_ORIENTATION=-
MAAVVVDAGSCLCKAGFSGEDTPRAVFPSVVGRLRHRVVMVGVDFRDVYVGDDALAKRGMLSIRYPIERGIAVNWEDMQSIWSHIFYNELEVSPEEYPVLLTEPSVSPKANHEQLIRIMFEAFNVPSLHVALQPVLSMYAVGRTTGVVLQSGHGVTCAVPVCEGFCLPHATKSLPVAGRELSEYLEQLLTERGFYFNSSHEREILQDMKEKLCWVALDFDVAMRRAEEGHDEKSFELPGGATVSIGSAAFQCPELLFQGARGAALESILKCGAEVHAELFSNIVLAGASTLFPGLPERLQRELGSLAPDAATSVLAPAHRKHGEWLGGATISSVSAFQQMWLTREEYDTLGPEEIHDRCMYTVV